MYRVLDIVIYQINVLLFDPYRAKKKGEIYAVRSLRRIVLLLLHNYIEILFWFALFYRNWSSLFCSKYVSLDSFLGSLYFSLVTMSTLGYGDVSPIETSGAFLTFSIERLALILTFAQTSIGICMAFLILTRFISVLPKPQTLDNLEK